MCTFVHASTATYYVQLLIVVNERQLESRGIIAGWCPRCSLSRATSIGLVQPLRLCPCMTYAPYSPATFEEFLSQIDHVLFSSPPHPRRYLLFPSASSCQNNNDMHTHSFAPPPPSFCSPFLGVLKLIEHSNMSREHGPPTSPYFPPSRRRSIFPPPTSSNPASPHEERYHPSSAAVSVFLLNVHPVPTQPAAGILPRI